MNDDLEHTAEEYRQMALDHIDCINIASIN